MYPQPVHHDGIHSLYKPGDIVQASYAFKKDRYEDLPFMQNDKLEIIGVAKDPNWAHARNVSGETGLIPLNYVRSVTVSTNLTIHSWYHGPISRKASEEIMHGYPVGSFLVRESDLFPGDLTLCLVGPPTPHFDDNEFDANVSVPIGKASTKKLPTPTNVQHYRVICRQPPDLRPSTMAYSSSITEYSLDEYDWFSNLPDLIKYYSAPDSGLVAPLLYPVVDLQRKRLNQLRNGGWIIRQGDLTLGDSIGRGEFGEVHKATYRNQQVAVKIYKKTACKLAITYEACLMSTLSHRNVVTFVGLVYEPDDAVYVLTEYIANGNLLTYLHSRTRNQIGQLTKLQFTVDACLGLEYLERRRIIHRDIAARNILLSGQADRLTAKVADFGMARHLDEPSLTGSPADHSPSAFSSRVSTRYPTPLSPAPADQVVLHDQAAIPVKWTAPEAVRDRTFSSKSDVWSFGILMWEIYSYGRIPYPRLMANQVIRQLATGYRMKQPEECPAGVYNLMTRTWRLNPDDRPNFSSILGELLELRQSCKSMEEGFARPVEVSQQQQRHPRAFTLPRQSENDRRFSWERNDCLEQVWTDNTTDPESDCYDCMEKPPAARTGVTETTMSRSFTNTPTASFRAAPPSTTALENTKRTAFYLPKFERFQL